MSSGSNLPVIISGTGPAALLLAHALVNASPSIPVRLFERDSSMTCRAQGYRVRIHGRAVQSCREILGAKHYELVRNTCATISEHPLSLFDAVTGAPFEFKYDRKAEGLEGEQLNADRSLLRKVLFKGLEPHTQFGKEIVGFESASAKTGDQSNGVQVHFSDGSSVRGAMLVGADGAFSRVRKQLTPQVKLRDSGMRMIFSKTWLTPELDSLKLPDGSDQPMFDHFVLPRDPEPRDTKLFFMSDPLRFNGRSAVAAAEPDLAKEIPADHIYWAFSLRSDQPEVKDINWRSLDATAASTIVKDISSSWVPQLRKLVAEQDIGQTAALTSAIMPVPLVNWRTSPDSPMATLIGDAAHVMPPTGGAGITLAFTDAAVLAAAIGRHGVSQDALAAYECEMREYATAAIEKSLRNGKMFAGMWDLEQMEVLET